MATNTGNGQTSPFGNGRGGAGGQKARPTNLITNPRGSRGVGAVPQTLTADNSIDGQNVGDIEPNPKSEVGGGPLPLADPPQATEIGTRAQGQNAHKPFKLGG